MADKLEHVKLSFSSGRVVTLRCEPTNKDSVELVDENMQDFPWCRPLTEPPLAAPSMKLRMRLDVGVVWHQQQATTDRIVWFARGGGLARSGPFATQEEAVVAMRLAEPRDSSGLPDDIFVWPERVKNVG